MPGEYYYPRVFDPETLEQTYDFELEGARLISGLVRGVGQEVRRRVLLFNSVHTLRNYMPEADPQEPEYDGDADRFVAQSRALLDTVQLEPKSLRFPEVKVSPRPATLDEIITARYSAWRHKNERDKIFPLLRERSPTFGIDGITGLESYRRAVEPYMLGTVKALTSCQRLATDLQFKAVRNNVLSPAIPATSLEVREQIEAHKITGVTVVAAERQLRGLPYVLAGPNFCSMSIGQRQEIVDKVGEEFVQFTAYAVRYGDAELMRRVPYPVLRRPISELAEVMEAPGDHVHDFNLYIHDVAAFDDRLAEVRNDSAAEKPLDQQLADLPDGEILQLVPPNETIRLRDLSTTVDGALAHMVQKLYAVRFTGVPKLETSANWNAPSKDIVARLIGKSNGRISNVRFQAVDAEEYLANTVTNWDPEVTPVDTARAYVLMADIRTGAKTVPTAFEFAVYIKKNTASASGQVFKSVRGRSTGDKVIADEIARSQSAAKSRLQPGAIVNKAKL